MLEFLGGGFEIPITTLVLRGSCPQCHRLQRFGHPPPLSFGGAPVSPTACVCSQTSGPVPPGSSWDIPAFLRADPCPPRALRAPLGIAGDVLRMCLVCKPSRLLSHQIGGGHRIRAWVGRWECPRPWQVTRCPHSVPAEPRGGEERGEDLPVHAPQAAADLVKPRGELAPAWGGVCPPGHVCPHVHKSP